MTIRLRYPLKHHLSIFIGVLLIIGIQFTTINFANAQSPGCDTNATGIVEIKINVPKTLSSYSVWLNLAGTKQADIGIDINNMNCVRGLVDLNSSTFSWKKLQGTLTANSGQQQLRIYSYSNSFSLKNGLLISDSCVPISDGSNCSTYEPPVSSSTTSTTSTSTTTTTKPITTTPGQTAVTPVTNVTSQVKNCWWFWCSVQLNWSPSTGGNGDITYKVTTDVRSPEYTKNTQHQVNWLPRGKTYPIKFQAIDSNGKKSTEYVIFCPIP